jgi:hypothetical protein
MECGYMGRSLGGGVQMSSILWKVSQNENRCASLSSQRSSPVNHIWLQTLNTSPVNHIWLQTDGTNSFILFPFRDRDFQDLFHVKMFDARTHKWQPLLSKVQNCRGMRGGWKGRGMAMPRADNSSHLNDVWRYREQHKGGFKEEKRNEMGVCGRLWLSRDQVGSLNTFQGADCRLMKMQ